MKRRAKVMLCLLPLVLFGLSAPPAHARVTVDQLVQLTDRVVILERPDGRWLEVRILKVEGTFVVVQLEDGSTGRVPMAAIHRVRVKTPMRPMLRRHAPRPQAPTDEVPSLSGPRYAPAAPSNRGAATTLRRRRKAERFYVEWIGLRTLVGFGRWAWEGDEKVRMLAHLELTLFALHWKNVYWEVLRIGGGEPFLFHVGGSIGYNIRLDAARRHELRLGAHLTFGLREAQEHGVPFGPSGLFLAWYYRPWDRFGFHLGLQQHSWPTGVSLVFGFSS